MCGCVFASTMPSLLDSPPQIPAAGGAWSSMYAVQETVKPPHLTAVVAAAAVAKKPASAYGGRKKNLEMCTEALGCETGAVDAAPPACDGADDKGDGEVEEAAECAERKWSARDEEEMEGRARRPLPPPLTTLARGASRVRMVHERRDGRLAVYAVRTPGVEAERSGGRLRMRLISLPSGSTTACSRQEPQDAEVEAKGEEEECGVAKYVRGGRCVEPEGAAAAARRGAKQWEPEQAAAFWVATS